MKTIVKLIYASNVTSFEQRLQGMIDAAPECCELIDLKFSTHFDTEIDSDSYSALLIFSYSANNEDKVKNFKICK